MSKNSEQSYITRHIQLPVKPYNGSNKDTKTASDTSMSSETRSHISR